MLADSKPHSWVETREQLMPRYGDMIRTCESMGFSPAEIVHALCFHAFVHCDEAAGRIRGFAIAMMQDHADLTPPTETSE